MNRLLPLMIVFSVCLVVFVIPTLGVFGVGLGVGYSLNYFVPAIELGHAAIIGVLSSLGGV